MPTPPDDLRGPLPAGQPYVYLSRAQASALRGPARGLAAYLPHLPCWVPQRRVADALGFDHAGIERCLERTGGAAYLFATQYENVHSLRRYDEPALTIDGRVYADSEARPEAAALRRGALGGGAGRGDAAGARAQAGRTASPR